MSLSITVFNSRQHEQFVLSGVAAHVGADATGITNLPSSELFLQIDDPLVSPMQLSLHWDAEARKLTLVNHGNSIALTSGARIHQVRTELALPVSFCIGDTQFQIHENVRARKLDNALTTLRETFEGSRSSSGGEFADSRQTSPGPETLGAWLETLRQMQRVEAGSKPLFQLAARAVYNPGGLDGAMILVPVTGGFKIVASHIPYPDHGIGFREDLVARVIESGDTIYHATALKGEFSTPAENDLNDLQAADDIHAAIVCPVLNDKEEVVAVVYGFRSLHRRNNRKGLRFLEAQFVQVVADSLSAGMVRLESEAEAARAKVLLEQAFAPSVARRLQVDRDALQGQTREVTVLFADLRGFSAIAERIGARESFDLLADVMDRLSFAITDHDGVIIDYYGDGVAAFWNAPLDQPEHPVLACQAAFEMLECLPEINDVWRRRLECELQLGIGIHTGSAQVGNSGSRSRLKYGPRGNTVNLASRLESLTKQVGAEILISGQTARQVEHVFESTRVVRSMLRGMSVPVDVCRVFPKTRAIHNDIRQQMYADGLRCFEAGELDSAVSTLRAMQVQFPEEAAAQFLLDIVLQQTQRQRSSDPDSNDVSSVQAELVRQELNKKRSTRKN